MSKRKPYNIKAGYIASLRSGINKGWVVIYDAEKASLDNKDGKYAVVCEQHTQIVNVSCMPKARTSMKSVCFCSECQSKQEVKKDG